MITVRSIIPPGFTQAEPAGHLAGDLRMEARQSQDLLQSPLATPLKDHCNPWGEVVQPYRKTLKLAQTRPTIATLKRNEDVPRVDCGQHPESALALRFNYVRCSN